MGALDMENLVQRYTIAEVQIRIDSRICYVSDFQFLLRVLELVCLVNSVFTFPSYIQKESGKPGTISVRSV